VRKNVVVIGSGPGGYVAAIRCAQRGMKVAIVEKGKIGGVCLNVGCIPTKALFKNAAFIKDLKKSSSLGVDVNGYTIDFAKMMKRKDSIVKQLTTGVKQLLKKNGVEVIEGTAKIFDSNTVKVHTSNGDVVLSTDHIIIATGSASITPPIPGIELEGVLSSEELLSQSVLPKSMAIIGGGVIGMEFASIYNIFGVDVTVIEKMPNILPSFDEEVTASLSEVLKERGVDIRVNTQLNSIKRHNGKLELSLDAQKLYVDTVLMSVGRRTVLPEFQNIDILIENGSVVVNDYMQSSIPNIYCIGDANGKMQLAHVASAEAIVAADHISLGDGKKMSYKTNPSVVYTIPEIASVGLTEKEALNSGKIKTGRFKYGWNGKALCMDETEGYMKVVSETKYNEILGVHIFGYDASNLIAEAGLALGLEATADEIAHTIHAHPTISEIFMECCEEIAFKSIHGF